MSARIVATARLRNHLRFAGMTYHGRVGRRRLRERVVERRLVVVPELALLEVAHRELPALGRVVVARLEPLALLVLVDGEEELDDRRAVVGEDPLEVVDLVVARRPDLARHEVMHAHDQHVLVVRSIEDADLALARHLLVDAPQVVVGELLGGRDLEGRDRAALRVERLHDLVDRAVLAGGIDALEDDEDRALRLRPEAVLEVGQAVQLLSERRCRRLLVPAVGLAVVPACEPDARAGLDAEGVAKVDPLGHGRSSVDGVEGLGRMMRPYRIVPRRSATA